MKKIISLFKRFWSSQSNNFGGKKNEQTLYRYKFTTQDLTTYDDCKWAVGKWKKTTGEGDLCDKGWLHCYQDPILAVFHDPAYGNYLSEDNPRLWRIEVNGKYLKDGYLKEGWTEMKLIEEVEIPHITTEQRVRYAIYCALEVHRNKDFFLWAENWLSGKDRTVEAANVVQEAVWAAWCAARAAAHPLPSPWTEAARAVEAELDLLALAKKAIKEK